MAGETVITVIGNLTADPELRVTSNNSSVVNFTIASTPRTLDRATNEWRDGDTLFLRCSAWNSGSSLLADNINSSLRKGMRIIVQGQLAQRSYQAQDGTNRVVYELRAQDVAVSLLRATADVVRSSASDNAGNYSAHQGVVQNTQQNNRSNESHGASTKNSSDPWGSEFDGSDLTDPADLPF